MDGLPPPIASLDHIKVNADETDSSNSATQELHHMSETEQKRKKKLELNRIASRVSS